MCLFRLVLLLCCLGVWRCCYVKCRMWFVLLVVMCRCFRLMLLMKCWLIMCLYGLCNNLVGLMFCLIMLVVMFWLFFLMNMSLMCGIVLLWWIWLGCFCVCGLYGGWWKCRCCRVVELLIMVWFWCMCCVLIWLCIWLLSMWWLGLWSCWCWMVVGIILYVVRLILVMLWCCLWNGWCKVFCKWMVVWCLKCGWMLCMLWM